MPDMDIIKQTNRTILFDVVNPEKPDLFTFMSDVPEDSLRLTDSKVREIHSSLLVKSFDEFLEKFKPTIYCYYGEKRDEYGEVMSRGMHYDLERPNGIPKELVKEIVIDRNNDFLKMFISMMDKKSSSGTINVDFNYENITKMLSPEKTLNDVKRIKKDIAYLEKKNAELESGSPAKEEATKNLITTYEKTKKYYNETSVQLKLMLGMLKENLNQLAVASKGGGGEISVIQPIFSGEKGELHAFNAPPPGFFNQLKASGAEISGELTDGGSGNSSPLAGFSEEEQKWLVSASVTDVAIRRTDSEATAPEKRKILTHQDYKNISVARIEKQFDDSMMTLYHAAGQEYDSEQNKNSLARELAVCAFTEKVSDSLIAMTAEEKINKYNLYSQINASWQKSFIRTAKPLIEKILNVKAFFDQYKPRIKQMQPSLLVVNANIEAIIDPDCIDNLKKYLNSVNNTSDYTDTIWFGIVPNIKFSEDSDITDIDEEQMRELGYTGDIDKGATIVPTELADLQELLNCVKDYKIQTFFSFEANEETTFMGLATGDVQSYIDKTVELADRDYSRYAIPCFPNFTVIPNDKSRVNLGAPVVINAKGEMVFSADREDAAKFWIYGVYISAAHVAAGLVAAYQCPKYLGTKFSRGVRNEFPGVRFDIETDAKYVPTTMAKEIGGYTETTTDILNAHKFGFVFSSDNLYINNNPVKNITVYKARCLKSTDNGGFESVFKETSCTYIYRYLKAVTDDFKKSALDRVFKSGGLISQWALLASGNYINSILRENDSITSLGESDGRYGIDIVFGGVSENMSVVINGVNT